MIFILFLKQDSVFQYVDKLSARTGGQTGVDLVSLKEYPVRIPEEIECQEKLVTILSVIDKNRPQQPHQHGTGSDGENTV